MATAIGLPVLRLPAVVPPRGRLRPTKAPSKGVAFACGGLGVSMREGGIGVIEKPALGRTQLDLAPELEEGGAIGRLGDERKLDGGDSYRVLLLDDPSHTLKLVGKVLPLVVPSVSPIQARKIFRRSRKNGVAVVIITVKEHAEFYLYEMHEKGLRSAIEPTSSR